MWLLDFIVGETVAQWYKITFFAIIHRDYLVVHLILKPRSRCQCKTLSFIPSSLVPHGLYHEFTDDQKRDWWMSDFCIVGVSQQEEVRISDYEQMLCTLNRQQHEVLVFTRSQGIWWLAFQPLHSSACHTSISPW